MGGIIPGTVPRIIPTLFVADVRVVSENGRGLYTRSGRRRHQLPSSLKLKYDLLLLNAPDPSCFFVQMWQ